MFWGISVISEPIARCSLSFTKGLIFKSAQEPVYVVVVDIQAVFAIALKAKIHSTFGVRGKFCLDSWKNFTRGG